MQISLTWYLLQIAFFNASVIVEQSVSDAELQSRYLDRYKGGRGK